MWVCVCGGDRCGCMWWELIWVCEVGIDVGVCELGIDVGV